MRRERISLQANLAAIGLIILAILLLITLLTCHTQKESTTLPPPALSVPAKMEMPQARSSDNIIQHKAYTLSYSKPYKQASWVAYLQTGDHSKHATEVRLDNFSTDPSATFGTATDQDYEATGFDRGHLAPAEDMAWSKPTMEESFYLTNISPQRPSFNRGVWQRLEALVRYWSEEYDSIYVVTGPVLTQGLPTIGAGKVSVPALFYKVVLQYNQKGTKAIGFVLPNQASAATLQEFAVTVDSVEHLTGINFFYRLPGQTEAKIESKINVNDWPWKRVRQ